MPETLSWENLQEARNIQSPAELLERIPVGITHDQFVHYLKTQQVNCFTIPGKIVVNGESIVVCVEIEGGMAKIFFGYYKNQPDRFVVIKMPLEHLAYDAVCEARSILEALFLEHSNVHKGCEHWPWLWDEGQVQHPDSRSSNTVHAMVLEMLPGIRLSDLIEDHLQAVRDSAFVASVAAQLAYSLEEIHEHGLVHRDIKPENIMITNKRPFVKLYDCGIAYFPGFDLAAPGSAIGTPESMSPEEACLGKQAEIASDQYSIGTVMYRMLKGSPIFHGSSQSVISQQVFATPQSLDTPLWLILRRLLAKTPKDRYPSSVELRQALAPHILANPEIALRTGDALTQLI